MVNPVSEARARGGGSPGAGRGIRIDLIGPFLLSVGGETCAVPARKDRAALAILALAPGRAMARARLAGLLWGDSSEARARDSLKQALRRLRQAIPPESGPLIHADRTEVRLDAAVAVDAAALEDGEAAPDGLLDLRRGPPLEGLEIADPGFRSWLLGERARLEEAFADLALRAMRRAEAEGRVAALARCARQLLAADPLNEEAARALMRRHLGRGERRQALQIYESLSQRLSAALGVPPETETAELARQIRLAQPAAAPRPATSAAASEGTFVVVLPFATPGRDPTQAYLADGLTEDVITDLGRIGGLRVGTRSLSFALGGRPGDPLEGARALGASHVLEGLVRQSGEAVRLNARLIATGSGQQVWAGRFDRPQSDVFLLQEELSRSVVSALRGVLAPEDDLGWHRGTGSVEAYRLFLRARSFYLRGLDRHSLGTARLLLQRATSTDRRYAGAYALLATCEFYLSIRSSEGAEDASRLCRAHAERAVSLDPGLAQARAALGLAHYNEGDYAGAEVELRRARDCDPDLYEPPFFLARNHRLRGEREEAARLYAVAAGLRPEDYRAPSLLAEELRALGRAGEAEAALRQAEARLLAAVDRHPDNLDALALGASVFAEMGRFDQAREWCRWALALGEGETLVQFNYNLMRAHVLMADMDAAVARLERLAGLSAVVRARLAAWMASDRDLDRALADPAFRALAARLAAEAGL